MGSDDKWKCRGRVRDAVAKTLVYTTTQKSKSPEEVEGSVTAKIIDLGLAKTLDESASEARISSPEAFVGTPEFASPEQFAGVGVDIRSDLYSLGVTLWVMVTGQTSLPPSTSP
jgi:serine/threonine protein kinase